MIQTCTMANAILDTLGIPAKFVRRVELVLDIEHAPLLRIERYVLGDKTDPSGEFNDITDMVTREWRRYTTRVVEIREEAYEVVPKEDAPDGTQ